jgi:hypothetical protein
MQTMLQQDVVGLCLDRRHDLQKWGTTGPRQLRQSSVVSRQSSVVSRQSAVGSRQDGRPGRRSRPSADAGLALSRRVHARASACAWRIHARAAACVWRHRPCESWQNQEVGGRQDDDVKRHDCGVETTTCGIDHGGSARSRHICDCSRNQQSALRRVVTHRDQSDGDERASRRDQTRDPPRKANGLVNQPSVLSRGSRPSPRPLATSN